MPTNKPKYQSTVRAPRRQQNLNELAKTFWDGTKQTKAGLTFAPGYAGETYLTGNKWNYIEIGVSRYDTESKNPDAKKTIMSPGLAEIVIKKEYARDVNKPVVGQNAVVIPQGAMVPTFNINILIWTAQQWAAFQEFVYNYVPTPRKVPAAYICNHPVLKLHNIDAIQIWGLEGPNPGRYPRSKEFSLICTQWAPVNTTIPPAPDENLYKKYYGDGTTNTPAATLETTPGNTTAPAAPQGL